MEHSQSVSGKAHFLGCEYVRVLKSFVLVGVGEAFLLHSRHVEYIKRRDFVFKAVGFGIVYSVAVHFILDISGDSKLLRGDKDEFYSRVARERRDE